MATKTLRKAGEMTIDPGPSLIWYNKDTLKASFNLEVVVRPELATEQYPNGGSMTLIGLGFHVSDRSMWISHSAKSGERRIKTTIFSKGMQDVVVAQLVKLANEAQHDLTPNPSTKAPAQAF